MRRTAYHRSAGGAWAAGLGVMGLLISVAIILYLAGIWSESLPSSTGGRGPGPLLQDVKKQVEGFNQRNVNLVPSAAEEANRMASPAAPAPAPSPAGAPAPAPAPAPVIGAPARVIEAPVPAPTHTPFVRIPTPVPAPAPAPAPMAQTQPAPAPQTQPAPSTPSTPSPVAGTPSGGTPIGPISPITPLAPIQEGPGPNLRSTTQPIDKVNKAMDDRNKELEKALKGG